MEGEREGEAPFGKNQNTIHTQLAQHCWSTSHLPGNEAAEGRGQAMPFINLTDSGKGKAWARVKRPRQGKGEQAPSVGHLSDRLRWQGREGDEMLRGWGE